MRIAFLKYQILCICSLLFTVNLFGQVSNTDIALVTRLLNDADHFVTNTMYDSAISRCKEVIKKTGNNNLKKFEAEAYNKLAEIMVVNGKMNEAAKYDSLLLPVAIKLRDTALIINAKNRIGINLMGQGNKKESADIFLSVLDLKLEKDQSIKTAEVYSNMASLYMSLGKNDQAMVWFFKSLRLYEKHNNTSGVGETYSNIASLYYLMGSTDEAINYQKKSIFYREKTGDLQSLIIPSINIGQLYILKDSFALSQKYLQQAVKYAEAVNNTKLMAAAYSGMATYHIRMKEFKPALEWQNKAIGLFEAADNKPMLSRLYVSAGNLSNASKDSAGAIIYFQKALGLSLKLGNKDNIANAYQKMSDFYFSHQNYIDAYQNFKNYTLYRDSIAMSSNLSNIEKVKIQYETEKKDIEISKLAADQRIKQLQIEKQEAILTGNMLEAAQKEKEIKLLSQATELQQLKIGQQDEQLEKQELIAKNNQQQLKLAETEKKLQQKQIKNSENIRNFMFAGIAVLLIIGYFLFNRYQLKRKIQEQEALLTIRSNIAKDLHDEIGSTLTSIKILSEVSEKNVHKDQVKASAFLQKITEQSAAAQQGISDIVWALKPENDKLENMVIRMREYVTQTLESKNIHTVINIDEKVLEKTLDTSQRRDFFLVFKEAVNNIAKYAAATEVHISLAKKQNDLVMQVHDNGKGFDTAKQTSSSGLKNMRSRAADLNGTLTITSIIDQGSSVILTIPAT